LEETPAMDDHPAEFSEAEIIAAFKFIDLDHNNYVGAKEIRHILVCKHMSIYMFIYRYVYKRRHISKYIHMHYIFSFLSMCDKIKYHAPDVNTYIYIFKFIDLDHNNYVSAKEIRHILVCLKNLLKCCLIFIYVDKIFYFCI
jgi:Ca2+-binding EF-hand superfamily protein